MEEIPKSQSPKLSLAPAVIGKLVETKEKTPTPPQKPRTILWIVLGLIISCIFVGIGLIVRNIILSSQKPDISIDIQSVINPSLPVTVSPTGETTQLISQDLLFESDPYQNKTAGFQINVPLGWKVDDSGKSGAIVVLMDPKVTMASDSAYLTFINITTGIPSSQNLANQVASAKSGIQKQFISYVFSEDQDMTVNGNVYHLLGGSYFSHNIKMRNRNLILLHDNKGYAISATAPESIWSKKELLLNASLFSFKNI
jgi:hypothetical protein